MQFPAWWLVSSYLKSHTATDARDPTRVPYVWASGAEGSGKTYYDVIHGDPATSDAWHQGMTLIERTQPVTGMFPFRSSMLQAAVEAEPERVFVVDVGGGRGNALVAIRGECGWGDYGAGMVLQDVGEVLEGREPVRLEGVRNVVHDFFEVQPVKGQFWSFAPRSFLFSFFLSPRG